MDIMKTMFISLVDHSAINSWALFKDAKGIWAIAFRNDAIFSIKLIVMFYDFHIHIRMHICWDFGMKSVQVHGNVCMLLFCVTKTFKSQNYVLIKFIYLLCASVYVCVCVRDEHISEITYNDARHLLHRK